MELPMGCTTGSAPGADEADQVSTGMPDGRDLPELSGEYRWASTEGGRHGMISVDEAEWMGWTKWRQDPRYPESWLMRRDD